MASAELAGANVTRGIVPIFFDAALLTQHFGYYLMSSDAVQSRIREKTYGAALMQINIGDLRKIKVSFPSLNEQKRIAALLDTLSAETQRLGSLYQQKLAALEALKKSLLHHAFSGELQFVAGEMVMPYASTIMLESSICQLRQPFLPIARRRFFVGYLANQSADFTLTSCCA